MTGPVCPRVVALRWHRGDTEGPDPPRTSLGHFFVFSLPSFLLSKDFPPPILRFPSSALLQLCLWRVGRDRACPGKNGIGNSMRIPWKTPSPRQSWTRVLGMVESIGMEFPEHPWLPHPWNCPRPGKWELYPSSIPNHSRILECSPDPSQVSPPSPKCPRDPMEKKQEKWEKKHGMEGRRSGRAARTE